MLIRFQYVREHIPTIIERISAISECSHLGNPRYHIHTNYDKWEESSSQTPKSRLRCTKYLLGSLIVCPVWRSVHVHYRQSISGRRSTHLRKGFFVSQNIPYWRYSHAPQIDRIDKRSWAILYLNRNLYTRWFMDVHGIKLNNYCNVYYCSLIYKPWSTGRHQTKIHHRYRNISDPYYSCRVAQTVPYQHHSIWYCPILFLSQPWISLHLPKKSWT